MSSIIYIGLQALPFKQILYLHVKYIIQWYTIQTHFHWYSKQTSKIKFIFQIAKVYGDNFIT